MGIYKLVPQIRESENLHGTETTVSANFYIYELCWYSACVKGAGNCYDYFIVVILPVQTSSRVLTGQLDVFFVILSQLLTMYGSNNFINRKMQAKVSVVYAKSFLAKDLYEISHTELLFWATVLVIYFLKFTLSLQQKCFVENISQSFSWESGLIRDGSPLQNVSRMISH